MAAIQKLRDKSTLLTVFIGIALLAFIITGLDHSMFNSRGENVIAEIDKQKYAYEEYQQVYEQVDAMYKNNPYMMNNPYLSDTVYNRAWKQFVDEQLVEHRVRQLGLGIFNEQHRVYGVSSEEFVDAIMGESIDREVMQFFNRYGITSLQQAEMFLADLPRVRETYPNVYEEWVMLERGVHQKLVAEKFKTLLAKSMYATTLEAEMSINERARQTDVLSVKIPFSSIPDDKVEVTDADLQAHYNKVKGKKQFEQEASVTLSYVVFDVAPTQADIEQIRQNVENKARDFQNAKNDAAFLNLNSDIKFNPTFYRKGNLSPAIDSFAFAGKKGDITPMFRESNMFMVAKISDIRFIADSAKVRHILLQGENTTKADSIKTLLEKGANFEQLVRQYSADSGSIALGGVIDWFHRDAQMVQSFKDTSFLGEKGKFYITPSEYGIHIIEILQQGLKTKEVQVQILAKAIAPSTDTRKAIKKEAVNFVSANRTVDQFNATLEKSNLVKRTATVSENQRSLPGIFESRALIRWAHQNKEKKNTVSDLFEFGDKFVVAVITDVYEKGTKSFEALKEQLRPEVVREKKVAMIKEQLSFINAQTTIQDIAAKMNVAIDTLPSTTFAQQSSTQIGYEPRVFATASILNEGQLSSPIEGNDGVFVIFATAVRTVEAGNVQVEKNMLQMRYESALRNAIMTILRDKATIKDYRIIFF
ncbi:MAG: peptidylprolyl isomerase [Bacteroidetes bacterium]|nr:peptidylprolyl isomerase [Bacteroidota bacterium]